jgi:xylose isomerase
MDAFARGLLIAQRIIDEGEFAKFIATRYGTFGSGIGAEIMAGKAGLADAERWVLANAPPDLPSGRQEMLENILNSYIF